MAYCKYKMIAWKLLQKKINYGNFVIAVSSAYLILIWHLLYSSNRVVYIKCIIKWAMSRENLSSGIYNQVRLKPAYPASEAS